MSPTTPRSLKPVWDTAPPPGDGFETRAPVEAYSSSASSSYRDRSTDSTLASSGQFRESVGSSFFKDTASNSGSMIPSRYSTQTNSHPHPKRPIIEADEIGKVAAIDNPPESPVQYFTISPRPPKKTCIRPESPSRENEYLRLLPRSKHGTKPPDPTDEDKAKTQEIDDVDFRPPLASDRVNDPPL